MKTFSSEETLGLSFRRDYFDSYHYNLLKTTYTSVTSALPNGSSLKEPSMLASLPNFQDQNLTEHLLDAPEQAWAKGPKGQMLSPKIINLLKSTNTLADHPGLKVEVVYP